METPHKHGTPLRDLPYSIVQTSSAAWPLGRKRFLFQGPAATSSSHQLAPPHQGTSDQKYPPCYVLPLMQMSFVHIIFFFFSYREKRNGRTRRKNSRSEDVSLCGNERTDMCNLTHIFPIGLMVQVREKYRVALAIGGGRITRSSQISTLTRNLFDMWGLGALLILVRGTLILVNTSHTKWIPCGCLGQG